MCSPTRSTCRATTARSRPACRPARRARSTSAQEGRHRRHRLDAVHRLPPLRGRLPLSARRSSIPEHNIVKKCNLCVDEIDAGRKPYCVMACMMRVLDIGPIDKLRDGTFDPTKAMVKGPDQPVVGASSHMADPELTQPLHRVRRAPEGQGRVRAPPCRPRPPPRPRHERRARLSPRLGRRGSLRTFAWLHAPRNTRPSVCGPSLNRQRLSRTPSCCCRCRRPRVAGLDEPSRCSPWPAAGCDSEGELPYTDGRSDRRRLRGDLPHPRAARLAAASRSGATTTTSCWQAPTFERARALPPPRAWQVPDWRQLRRRPT
jgi:hypothetical protein